MGEPGGSYFFNGQRQEAVKAYEKELGLILEQLAVNPKNAALLADAAACYGRLGKRAEALEFLDKSLQLGRGDKELLFNAAVVYNELGDTGVALEWLQKAISAGYFSLGGARLRPSSTIFTTIHVFSKCSGNLPPTRDDPEYHSNQLAFVHHGPLTFNRSRQGESLYEKD